MGDNSGSMRFWPWGTNQFIFLYFFLLMATPVAYRSSRARGWIGAAAQAYTTACGNTRSLAHWWRMGTEPSFSQRQCWVLNLLGHNGSSYFPPFKVGEDSFSKVIPWVRAQRKIMEVPLLEFSFPVCHITVCISQHRQDCAAGTNKPRYISGKMQ